MSVKLSIIIPCYNCADTLSEAVDSCYKQGFSEDEFEIIMTNDGSTDSTKELMDDIAKKHQNIFLIHHIKNLGGGAARNTAIKASSSEVIFCLDSDDILPANTLSQMLKFLQEKSCNGVSFQFSKKFKGSDTNDIVHIDEFSFNGLPIPFSSLFQIDKLSPVVVVFMFTKESFARIGGYPTHHGFDTQGFGWRFLSAGYKVLVCPNTTYLHRVQFKESYYLREYTAGKTNFNMRAILLEHLPLFTPEARNLILNFNYSDFTHDIMGELKKLEHILIPNYTELLGSLKYTQNQTANRKFISRKSLKGLLLRIKTKLLKYFKL